MTNEEIEKGLEICAEGACKSCPYHEYGNCLCRIAEDSLDYIKRLKTENEMLTKAAETSYNSAILALGTTKELTRKETAKEIFGKLIDSLEPITDEDGCHGMFVFSENLFAIAKEYGVEVGE